MAKKVTALTKITSEAKRLRKGNNMEWKTAVKKASKLYNSGALGTVAKVGAKKPAKKKAARYTIAKKPYAVTRYETTGGGKASEVVYKSRGGKRTNVKTVTTKRVSGVSKVLALNKEIDKLEALRKAQPTKAKKDGIQIFINAKHRELNQYLKSKQA